MQRIWIAVGAGGALLTAGVLVFTLTQEVPKTAKAEGTQARATTPGAAAARPASARAASGGVDTPEAKAAWLRERFGPDLNADADVSAIADQGERAEPAVRPTRLVRLASDPLPADAPPVTAEAARKNFERDTSKMLEHFPDAKDAVEEMKAEIAAAQQAAKLAAEQAAAAEQAQR